jgi:CheY-like chemotaxis protein
MRKSAWKRTANYRQVRATLYTGCVTAPRTCLDVDVVCPENDAVISSTESHSTESATRTILIVDDDRSVADTFARILKLEGFEVATAMSAEAGLELADNVGPDAIILDMRMPITNGLQFLRLIRSKPHLVEVPVAIVTGDYFLADAIQNELRSLGASIRFKPMYLEDLLTLARTMVA